MAIASWVAVMVWPSATIFTPSAVVSWVRLLKCETVIVLWPIEICLTSLPLPEVSMPSAPTMATTSTMARPSAMSSPLSQVT